MKIRSIRTKFIVGFFVIFSALFLMLNQTVTRIIETSNRNIITDDLVGLKKNGNSYVRQAFLINHFANDDIYFGQIAKEIVADLRFATSSEVGAYTVDGVLLQSTDPAAFAGAADDDLTKALQGATAYTIAYDKGSADVLFSYPVVIDGTNVGILRYAKRFNLLYEQTDKLLDTIFYIALAIFAAAFLFSYLLTRHITVPLVKLAKATSDVTNGNLEVRLATGRKDEIGRLTGNFNEMVGRIRSQIGTIERDRDRLKKLNAERKLFFDNVTHELKTPLTSILGYAEIIRENGEGDEAFFRKGMTHIVEESKRLHELVLALLEVSRETVVTGAAERVDAGRVLADVCDAMSFKARRYGNAISLEAEEGLYVLATSEALKRLFINLIDNAIKHGEANEEIEVAAGTDGATVWFVIANKSRTIPSERLERMFEPFFIADRSRKEKGSLGLGLNIAKSIVDEWGGEIRMESADGRTSVNVRWPAHKEANPI